MLTAQPTQLQHQAEEWLYVQLAVTTATAIQTVSNYYGGKWTTDMSTPTYKAQYDLQLQF